MRACIIESILEVDDRVGVVGLPPGGKNNNMDGARDSEENCREAIRNSNVLSLEDYGARLGGRKIDPGGGHDLRGRKTTPGIGFCARITRQTP